MTSSPGALDRLVERWRLTREDPLHPPTSPSRVLAVRREDGSPAVLKLAVPHMEARDEAAGLRFWDGDPTVRLLDHDPDTGVLLLERCIPGAPLASRPAGVQDEVLAALLRRLWRPPPERSPFRSLRTLFDHWVEEAREEGRERATS